MVFEVANSLAGRHLVVQPADAVLDPPEAYLYVQDFLIISCGVVYELCYAFYICRTIRDKTMVGTIEYLGWTMAYEVYYTVTTTRTVLERACFLVWFLLDITFARTALRVAYAPERRKSVISRTVLYFVIGLVVLQTLCSGWPDDWHQVTAYWTGLALQFPVGWPMVAPCPKGDQGAIN